MQAFSGERYVVYESEKAYVGLLHDKTVQFYYGNLALMFTIDGFLNFGQAVVDFLEDEKLNKGETDLFMNTPCSGINLRIPFEEMDRFFEIIARSMVEIVLIRELSLINNV